MTNELRTAAINMIVRGINDLCDISNADAAQRGFWDTARNDGELIALHHSELSEALEGFRAGNPPDDKIPAFSSVEAEFADTIIRICDHAGARKFRLGAAIAAKLEYNRSRPHMHGKKF